MARLINTIEDLKKHLTISASFDFKLVLPYAKRAERKFIISQIGHAQYVAICDHTLVEDSNLPIDRVKLLLEEVAANFSVLLALDFINIQLTNSGAKKTTNTNSENADWRDIRDLKRMLSSTANEALDDALEIMEDYPGFFLDWSSSDLFTLFNSMIVSQTKYFQAHWDIQKNRQTFKALVPHMVEVEDQFLKPLLGSCTLDFIKQASSNQFVLDVQLLSRKAIVALTISKVCITGTFSVTSSSLVVSSEVMPWEKSNLELSEEKLERLHNDRLNAGTEYLKQIKNIVKSNPSVFTCYEDKEENGLNKKIIKKKSHLFL